MYRTNLCCEEKQRAFPVACMIFPARLLSWEPWERKNRPSSFSSCDKTKKKAFKPLLYTRYFLLTIEWKHMNIHKWISDLLTCNPSLILFNHLQELHAGSLYRMKHLNVWFNMSICIFLTQSEIFCNDIKNLISNFMKVSVSHSYFTE